MCLPFKDLAKRTTAQGEHDGVQWQIVHNGIGHRCGYIRVLPGHPWFGKHYDEIDASVHGGLTFSDYGKACPTHGDVDEWWIGFDTAHAGDLADPDLMHDPKLTEEANELLKRKTVAFNRKMERASWTSWPSTIKDNEYVREQCFSLIEQYHAAQMIASEDRVALNP